jgi:hypothetical protein
LASFDTAIAAFDLMSVSTILPVRFSFEYAIAVAFQTPVAIVPTDVSDDAVTFDARVAPVRVPAAAVTTISSEPLKATPLMFLAVCSVVAVDAFPVKAPVNDVDETDDKPDKVVADPPRDISVVPTVILEFTSFELAIEPASIVFVTVPESPVVTKLPDVAGIVKVFVPAIAGTDKVTLPLVLPEKIMLVLMVGDVIIGVAIVGVDAKTKLPVPVVPEIRPRKSDEVVVC